MLLRLITEFASGIEFELLIFSSVGDSAELFFQFIDFEVIIVDWTF